jgi:phosphoribosylaminoimidazole-succinocarboxamide synthase
VDAYVPGGSPPSYDKQLVRDWLERYREDGKPWNKRAPAPRLHEALMRTLSEGYIELSAVLGID